MRPEETRTWAEIDFSSLEHNYRQLRACAPRSRFLGIVKADAYGHGAVPVARKLEQLGADYLAVACPTEAMELRDAGIQTPILLLGATPPELAEMVVEHGLTQTVSTMELAQALSQAAEKLGKKAKAHLKLDTGMSRLGLLAHEAKEAAEKAAQLCRVPDVEFEGVFTHFANADEDGDYTRLQFTRFMDTLEELEKGYGITFAIRHCAASAAVLNYPCTHLDMIRPGIALYGHYPDPSCRRPGGPELRPVMTLKSRVAAVRELPEGTPVSYGCTARMEKRGRVAVVPIGYADGLHRGLSNRGCLWLDGKARPILGRVCMDMCMVALDEDARVEPGDVAEVFGCHMPVEKHADLLGTVQYELLCAVSPRVNRIYLD
ncbi:MAG: alanine racemase [Oscillospiraceae bacterium]|nr:alanine racemase [Oscillospiraceae bacterium]